MTMAEHFRAYSAVFPVILRKEDKEVLLHLRQGTGFMDGYWDFAGSGHVEEGEIATQALVRECAEKTGLCVQPSDAAFAHVCHRVGNPDGRTYYDLYFTIRRFTGEPRIAEPEKCAALRWFPVNALPCRMIPLRRKALEAILRQCAYSEYTAAQLASLNAVPPVRLVPPTERDEAAVMAYRLEFLESGDSMDGTAGLQKHLQSAQGFREWLGAVRDNQSEQTVRTGMVPATTLLALDGQTGALVGMIDIRHRLNDGLLQSGGHIGYSVRKSCRRRGYASCMLAEALRLCERMGISRVLVTCDKQNIASARTIQKNGGVLENEVAREGRVTQRYWIEREETKL